MAMRSLAGDQRGFTIVEVLVAATLLVVGVLGTMSLVDTSNAKTSDSRGREGATNLAREVVEGARTVGYKQLEPYTIKAALQVMPGLANSGIDWTVKRRGFAYTLNVSVCAVDDPKDGYGSHAGAGFCADSSATGGADAQPDDSKRVTVDISWKSSSKDRTLRQVALIASDGAVGPPVTSLVATAPVVADPAAPEIASSGVTSASFRATVPAGVDSVIYSLDGSDKGIATAAANGTDWSFTLPISDLSDGGYDVSVRAVDATGVAGPSFAIPLNLIRGQPAAPAGLVAGPNTVYVNGVLTPVVEVEWRANSERNVIGYRTYNSNGALVCPASTGTLDAKLSCIDFAATGGTYSVVALYRDAAGLESEGSRASVGSGASGDAKPDPPTSLSAAAEADGTTRLSWSAPTSGSPVSFYRIYRDGRNYTNRYDTTGSVTDTTYVDDPGGASHTYYVTAVSANLAESVMAGPVTM